MAINDLIAQGVRPVQIQSPFNAMAKLQAMREAEQQNALFMQKQQDHERALQVQNALRQRLAAGGVTAANASDLLQYGTEGQRVHDAIIKADKEKAEVKDTESKIKSRLSEDDKRTAETIETHLKTFRTFAPSVRTPEGVQSYVEAMYAHPVLGPMAAQTRPKEQALQDNLALFAKDPRQWLIANAGLTGDKVVETLKGTRQHINTGGTTLDQKVDYFGDTSDKVDIKNTESPDALLRSQDARLDRAQRATQHAETQKNPVLSSVIDPADSSKMLRIDANKYQQGTSIGAPGVYGHTDKEPVPGVTLPAKEVQKREAAHPKAAAGLRQFNDKADQFVKDMEDLQKHPGLNSITGLVAGHIPIGITKEGRAALAKYKSIIARGGFTELQAMRDASPSGGALGNVSNEEGNQLRAAFGELDRAQNAEDLKNGLAKVIARLKLSKERIQQTFDETYEYRARQNGAKPATPKPADPNEVDASNPLLNPKP